ncbi:MAG: phage tail protein [Anaerolineae bacterium]|nr:phage tail protein [Anaerolineae bacterium]
MALIDEDVPALWEANLAESGLKTADLAASRLAGAAASAVTAYGTRSWEKGSGMRFDPAPAYLFYVELSGIIVGAFSECSGLSLKRGTETVKEGGVNNFVHKLPGRMEFSNITLKRGLTVSRQLWSWMTHGRYNTKVRRINFSIIQGAPGHNLVTAFANAVSGNMLGEGESYDQFITAMGGGFGKIKHWDIEDAYPVEWKVSDLDTTSEKVAIETLEIAHHGLSLSYEVLTPMSITAGAANLL